MSKQTKQCNNNVEISLNFDCARVYWKNERPVQEESFLMLRARRHSVQIWKSSSRSPLCCRCCRCQVPSALCCAATLSHSGRRLISSLQIRCEMCVWLQWDEQMACVSRCRLFLHSCKHSGVLCTFLSCQAETSRLDVIPQAWRSAANCPHMDQNQSASLVTSQTQVNLPPAPIPS